jgi:acetolactate synthase-1/2/3 large subunit
MKSKVSDLIAQFLKDKGIEHVFGIIGAGNAHIFDSIGKLGYTQIVSVHHEQSAVMAMGTYYRTCGKVCAAIVTTGAGSTNAVTGVVSTWMDSIPGLIIAGNEKSTFCKEENPLRIWGVQGYDSVAMVSKVTKYSARVSDPKNTMLELEKSYAITQAGRPGPCWLEIPMDIQSAQVELDHCPQYVAPAITDTKKQNIKQQVTEVIEKIKNAKRPLLWLGHGIRLAGAEGLIGSLLEKTKIPALVSWQGIDMIDSSHPLVFGRAGVYGQRSANFVLQNCDLLICIGTRLALPQIGYDTSELTRAAQIIVVDIDKTELEKYPERFNMTIHADASEFIKNFLGDANVAKLGDFSKWLNQCNLYKEKYPAVGPEHDDAKGFINSYRFLDRLSDDMKPDQHVVTDMGTALLSGHQVMKFKKGQRLMTSTGLGEMGFGLPAALGVSFARNQGEVLCLNCDGGMMMNLQELQTIVHHELPVKIIVFNNDGYLMIKHTQKNLFKGNYVCTDKKSGVTCPDYSKVAKAFDIPSYQIRTWQDYDKVIGPFLNNKGPAMCEVFMDPEQYFYPKLGLALQKDGSIISPPLEDLSPLLPREELKENMIVGLHPKSLKIDNP